MERLNHLITPLEIFKMSIAIHQPVCITLIDSRATEQAIKRTSSVLKSFVFPFHSNMDIATEL